MDDHDPAYWRALSRIGAAIVLVGLIHFWVVQAGGCKYQTQETTATCVIDGKPVDCRASGFPVPYQTVTKTDHTGIGFGLILMAAGLGVGLYASSNLYRIKNEITDRAYRQMQSEATPAVKVRCPSCGTLNDEADRFCGHCGKPL